jgi:hypothetical protein
LLPILSKLFTAILRERIQYWADINNKIKEAQFGFRQGRRTTDPLFIINIIKKGNQHFTLALLTLLIKAFDSVNHGLLWSKLASMGLSGRMLKILQSMYGKATSRVVANGTMSPTFHCSKGVRHAGL